MCQLADIQPSPISSTHRIAPWKLVRDFLNPERDELFNLQKDPGETTNVINDDSPEVEAVIKNLHTKILAKMREVNDSALELSGKR